MEMNDQTYYGKLNRITQRFTEENQKYFSRIRQYLLTSVMTHDKQVLQEQVLSMAADMLEAQENGENAEEFFGHEPKKMADELLQQTPQASFRSKWHYVGSTVMLTWFFLLLSRGFVAGKLQLPLGNFIAGGVLTVLFFYAFYSVVKRNAFINDLKRLGLLLGATIVGFGLGMLVVYIFVPDFGTLMIPHPWDLGIIGGSTLAMIGYLVFKGSSQGAPLLLMVVGLGGWSTVYRYRFDHQMPTSSELDTWVVVTLAVAYLLMMVWMIYLLLPKKKRSGSK